MQHLHRLWLNWLFQFMVLFRMSYYFTETIDENVQSRLAMIDASVVCIYRKKRWNANLNMVLVFFVGNVISSGCSQESYTSDSSDTTMPAQRVNRSTNGEHCKTLHSCSLRKSWSRYRKYYNSLWCVDFPKAKPNCVPMIYILYEITIHYYHWCITKQKAPNWNLKVFSKWKVMFYILLWRLTL